MFSLTSCRLTPCAVLLGLVAVPLLAQECTDPQLQGRAAVDYLRATGQYQSFLETLAVVTDQNRLAAGPPGAPEAITGTQQAYLKASNTDANDFFGGEVAVSGNTIVVGAVAESSNTTGVNGNQNDNSAAFSGAAYVFVRSGTTWSQQAYLKASNAEASDYFGDSVAIYGDTIVVGAPLESSNATGVNGDQNDNSTSGAGAAFVFVRSGTNWSQQAYLKASDTGASGAGDFGNSVAISGDTIVVASSNAAYVFVRSGAGWSQQAHFQGFSNVDHTAVAISEDMVVVGSTRDFGGSGAAQVFVRSGTTWSNSTTLRASNPDASDFFGYSVAASGDTIVVGAIWERSRATGVNGDQSDNSLQYAGAAYVFVRSAGSWTQQAYLKPSNTGASYFFGSVAISGDRVLVGASGENSNATGVNGDQQNSAAIWSGAAYLFVRSGTAWSQQAYLKASNTGAGDRFGGAVAISGEAVIVGANEEDSSATGVNGTQNDNSATASGAAYVFRVTPDPPPGPWQQTSALPGFRFKVLIGSDRAGTQVSDCVPQTLCIAGAIPTRAELFVRLIGPRGNGKLWAQAVRFTVSQVELWIEQTGTGKVNYYRLEALPASTDTLNGVNDSLAFDP